MRARFPLVGFCLAVAALAIVLTIWARSPGAANGHLPTVRIHFPTRPFADLFASAADEDGKDPVPVLVDDAAGEPRAAKASLRGFSAWHHGTTKPSLRLKYKDAAASPEFVELSRPEDPLALCNWLPDQLADGLGLLHERSAHVALQLDARNAGIYLKSLRPGDDLAAAAGRARGTFWKGDALGERRHLDLWAGTAAWRSAGADDPLARQALDELLAALREPVTARMRDRLAAVLDLEAAARAAAVAVLVGSIHADRAHNHVLFFDPTHGRLEPLLWDANGFGIHAEPDLPVEVARHPLADRLLHDVRFVHRRNQILWDLMHGAGSTGALVAQADTLLARFGAAFVLDPEPVRLVLQNGVFTAQRLGEAQRGEARSEFVTFVQRRQTHLRAHFAAAQATIAPHPDNPAWSLVTVAGTVAVRLERADGGDVRSPDGHDAALLWPGLTARLFDTPQHRGTDGRGVPAPHARPAPLVYAVASVPATLRVSNAFTGQPVGPVVGGAPDAGVRSVHPWLGRAEAPRALQLGPGEIVLDEPLAIGPDGTLTLAPGTTLVLRSAARIDCRGAFVALGSASAPIAIRRDCSRATAVECRGGARVQFTNVGLHDATPWANDGAAGAPLLTLRDCADATLAHCRITHSAGDGLVVVGGTCRLSDTVVHGSHGTALTATGGTTTAERCTFAFARTGVLARDGARVRLGASELRGNLVGARAERSARPFAGACITLDTVVCRENGQCDVDADPSSTIELRATTARRPPARN